MYSLFECSHHTGHTDSRIRSAVRRHRRCSAAVGGHFEHIQWLSLCARIVTTCHFVPKYRLSKSEYIFLDPSVFSHCTTRGESLRVRLQENRCTCLESNPSGLFRTQLHYWANVARIYSDIFTTVAKVIAVWPSDFEKDKLQTFTSGHPDFGKMAAKKLKICNINRKL
jgi:hypothetical protein